MTGGVRMVEEASAIPMNCPAPTHNPQRAICDYSDNSDSNENSIRNEVLNENVMQIVTDEDSTGEDNSGEYQVSEPQVTDDSDPSIELNEDSQPLIELNPDYQFLKEQSQESVLTQSDEGTQSEYFTAESQPGGESSQESQSLASDEGDQSDSYYTADSQLTTESSQETLAPPPNEVMYETHSIQSDEGSQSEVLSQTESRPSTELSQETCSVESYESNESEIDSHMPAGSGTETQSVLFGEIYEVELNPHIDVELRGNKTLEGTQPLIQTEPQNNLSEETCSVQLDDICEGNTTDNTQPKTELLSQTELSQENQDNNCEIVAPDKTQPHPEPDTQKELSQETQDDNCEISNETQPHPEPGPQTELSQETQDDNCEISNETQPHTETGPQTELSQEIQDENCEIETSTETQPHPEPGPQTELSQETQDDNCEISNETQPQTELEPQTELSQETQDDNCEFETSKETQPHPEPHPQTELSQETQDDSCEVSNETNETQPHTENEPQTELSQEIQDDNCEISNETQPHPEPGPQTELSQEIQDDNCEIETSTETQPHPEPGTQTVLSQETQDDNCEISNETQPQNELEPQTELSQKTQDGNCEIKTSKETQPLTEPEPQTELSQETQDDNCEISNETQPHTKTGPQTELSQEIQDDNCEIETSTETQPHPEPGPQTELSQETQDDNCEISNETQPQTELEPQTELSQETQDGNCEIKTSKETQPQTEPEPQTELSQETQDDNCEFETSKETQPHPEPHPQTELSQETQDDNCDIEKSNETQSQAEPRPQTELSQKFQDNSQEAQLMQLDEANANEDQQPARSAESNANNRSNNENAHIKETNSQSSTIAETDQVECQEKVMNEIMEILQDIHMDNTQEIGSQQSPGSLAPNESSQDRSSGQSELADVEEIHSDSGERQPTRSAESNEHGPSSNEEALSGKSSSHSTIDVEQTQQETSTLKTDQDRENAETVEPQESQQSPGNLAPTEASPDKQLGQSEHADVVEGHDTSGKGQSTRSAESNENGSSSKEETRTEDRNSQSNTNAEEMWQESSATETEQDTQVESQDGETVGRNTQEPQETLQSLESLAPTESNPDRQISQSQQADLAEGNNTSGEGQPAKSTESNENGSSSKEETRTEDRNSQSNTDAEETRQENSATETDQDTQVESQDGETAVTVESDDNQYEGDNSSDSSDEWEPKRDDAISAGNSDSGAEVEDDTSQECEAKINSSELYITIKGNAPDVENGDSESPHGFDILEIFREEEETNPKYESKAAKPKKDPNVEEPFMLRRSSRVIKRKRYYEDIDIGDNDSDIDDDDFDIDDIQATETYKRKAKSLIGNDTKTLIEMAAKQSKLNKGNCRILPRQASAVQLQHRRCPAGMSTLAAYSLCQDIMSRGTTVTAISSKANASTESRSPHPLVLPTLKDDMFVLETPSFIVPYVYEKPSIKPFREFVDVLGSELEEQKIKAEKVEQEKRERSNHGRLDKKNAVEISEEYSKEIKNYSSDDEQLEMIKEIKAKDEQNHPKELEKRVNLKRRNSDNDISWDDESASDSENEEGSDNKAKTDGIKDVTDLSIEKVVRGKTDNYFHSSLGKFFMDIGLSLAQEHVQSDLLNLNNKKLKKEKKLGIDTKPTEHSIMSLKKNLEFSKQNNAPFHFPLSRCEKCNFKTESSITLSHHMEAPHFKDGLYKCNMCVFQTRNGHDILYHTEAEHNVRSRLERSVSYHQCPNCPFEDSGKSKLARHSVACSKKFKPSLNCAPTSDWEPPAKIPKQMGHSRLFGSSNNVSNAFRNGHEVIAGCYRSLVGKNVCHNDLGGSAALYRSQEGNKAFQSSLGGHKSSYIGLGANKVSYSSQKGSNAFYNGQGNRAFDRSQGERNIRPNITSAYRPRCSKPLLVDRVVKGTTHYATMKTSAVVRGITIRHCNSNTIINFPVNECRDNPKQFKKINIPEVTITPLPLLPSPRPSSKNHSSNDSGIDCEICDEHMHDRQHLLDHMQWIHKVKIAPRMINLKPPLACKKCPLRFRTDQGLERHLLGAHGLVTNSIQDAANKGLDGGRCPVCGKVYQRMLLNHVEREHRMKLKPASLSYKCNVCMATFTMYKYFENHIFSVHSNMTRNNAGMPQSDDEEKDFDVVEINDIGAAIPRPRRVPVITSAKAFNTASASVIRNSRFNNASMPVSSVSNDGEK